MSEDKDVLSSEEHARIFRERILEESTFSTATSQERPRVIILAGQPGAGKGSLARSAEVELGRDAVVVDPDALRDFHPKVESFRSDHPYTWADDTHPDASAWAKELRAAAIDGRKNLILDTTLGDGDKAVALVNELKAKGYDVEVRAVAANRLESELGVDQRFAKKIDLDGYGRYVPEDIREQVYRDLPDNLNQVAKETGTPIRIFNREGVELYDSRTDTRLPGAALEEVREARLKDPGITRDLRDGWRDQQTWHRDLPENLPGNSKVDPATRENLLAERSTNHVAESVERTAREAIDVDHVTRVQPARIRAGTALGVAGLALEVYDGAESVRTAQRLHGEGNATAAESELIHFGARTVGGWTGAGIGMATGAALGVESGPGLLVTGAIGGVAGVFGGSKIAQWNDNRGIYNQELGGKSWAYDPDNPALGWRSKAPIDNSNDGIDNARRGDLRASPATENRLNYQATSRSVELVLGGPPAQRSPFSIPAEAGDTPSSRPSNWERNPGSGQWQREVYGPFVERGMTPHRTESAEDAALVARLDRQAAQIVVHNAANSPASIAARYEDTYIRNGWAAYGEMPQAVRNARTDVDTLVASDENRYQRRADGEWVSTGLIYNSTASGNLREELDATRDVLLARLPPPREILPVPPMDADARLRDTVAGAYRNAGVDPSAEQIAVAATAVRATWDANGLDPATTALQARPQRDGRSELASLRLDTDGKTYVIAAVTTPENIERARTEMTTAPHAIERASEHGRDVREQVQREGNRQGLSQDQVQQAMQGATTTLVMRGAPSAHAADAEAPLRQDHARERESAQRMRTDAPAPLPPDFAPSQQGPRDLRDPQHEGNDALREMQHRAKAFEAQQHIPHGPHTDRLAASMLQFAVENDFRYGDVRVAKHQDTGQVQLEHARYGQPTQRFAADLAAMSSQPIEATSQRINETVSRHNSHAAPAVERTREQAQGLSGYSFDDKVMFAHIRGGTPGHISDDHVALATRMAKENGIDANKIARVSMVGDQIRVLRSGPDEKTVLVDVNTPAPPLQASVAAVNTINQQQAQTLAQQQDPPTQDGPGRGPRMV